MLYSIPLTCFCFLLIPYDGFFVLSLHSLSVFILCGFALNREKPQEAFRLLTYCNSDLLLRLSA